MTIKLPGVNLKTGMLMATQGQILDISPLGMIFKVVKSKTDT